MAKRAVPRPKLRTDWELRFADRGAEKGWRDLKATQLGPVRSLYDLLERDPLSKDNLPKHHPLKGQLGTVMVAGVELHQWQHELANGARVWFAVDESNRIVWLTRCATSHPNETK